jgi:hypothetical protein
MVSPNSRMQLKSVRDAVRAENKARQAEALKVHSEQIDPDSFQGRYNRLDEIVNPPSGCHICGNNH